jgi:hypothetical protein
MKGAIFHDYYKFIGGGEILALSMAKILHADLITTDSWYSPDDGDVSF